MGKDDPSFELLDVDNYATWSIRMRMLLEEKSLWVAVDPSVGTQPDVTASRKALALIVRHVASHHLQAVMACGTGSAAWQYLENTYKAKSQARRLQLHRELSSVKKGTGETLTKYFGRVREIAMELTTIGATLDSTEVAHYLLAGLPKDYGRDSAGGHQAGAVVRKPATTTAANRAKTPGDGES